MKCTHFRFCKKQKKNLEEAWKNVTFAPQLSNGVMVAQQVLVLFVVVRIRLGQRFLFQEHGRGKSLLSSFFVKADGIGPSPESTGACSQDSWWAEKIKASFVWTLLSFF